MASTVSNGNDRSEKWHRPFQMATTVYEREICVIIKVLCLGFYSFDAVFLDSNVSRLVNCPDILPFLYPLKELRRTVLRRRQLPKNRIMIYTVFLVSLLFILSKILLFQIRLTLRVNKDFFVISHN